RPDLRRGGAGAYPGPQAGAKGAGLRAGAAQALQVRDSQGIGGLHLDARGLAGVAERLARLRGQHRGDAAFAEQRRERGVLLLPAEHHVALPIDRHGDASSSALELDGADGVEVPDDLALSQRQLAGELAVAAHAVAAVVGEAKAT